MSASHAVSKRRGSRQGAKVVGHSFPLTFNNRTSGADYLLGIFDGTAKSPMAMRIAATIDIPDNSGTSAVLRLGTAAGGTQIQNDVDIKAAAGTGYAELNPLRLAKAKFELWARITRVGTAPTAGRVFVTVEEFELNVTKELPPV